MPTRNQMMRWLLTPLSWLYDGVTMARNWMFDNRILRQAEYEVPVISVGNITVGGTGKTPHVEYIVQHLSQDYNIAVLSRGYKRKTKGFLIANSNSTPDIIGDEPLQIYHKYGVRVKVAVCESRKKGIAELMRQFPDINLIVLDDAFQHRYVRPKISVLLTDYNRPIYKDKVLPLGRLRENWRQVERADMVIVTKCPEGMTPLDYRLVYHELGIRPYQSLYFSAIHYGGLLPVFPDDNPYSVHLSALSDRDTVLLLTGIANPRGFVRHFKHYPFRVVVAHYPDHHDFKRKDIKVLTEKFDKMKGERKVIITTEKDAVRLAYNPYLPVRLKPFVFYIPIGIKIVASLNDTDFISDIRHRINEKTLE